MPRCLDMAETPEELLYFAQAGITATKQAYDNPSQFGRDDPGRLMAEYNALLAAAARVLGSEINQLFRPYDLNRRLGVRPETKTLTARERWAHFWPVLSSFEQLASYLEAKTASTPIFVEAENQN